MSRAYSPTFPSLYLRLSSFSNPSFHFPTSQALHVIHLASRPCCTQGLFLLCRAAVVLTWFSDVNIVERVLDKYRNTLLCFKAFRYLVKRGKFTERVVNARTNKKYRIAGEAYLRNLHSQWLNRAPMHIPGNAWASFYVKSDAEPEFILLATRLKILNPRQPIKNCSPKMLI